MRTLIIKTLDLPTTYKVVQSAKGNLSDGRYVEIASLHSGTGGHIGVRARYLNGVWSEINQEEYKQTVREIFSI